MDTAAEQIPLLSPYVGDSGTCNDPNKVLEAINSARDLLWNKVNAPNTMDYLCICCVDSCFTLPSAYKKVQLAWLGGSPISIGNEWYQSIPQTGRINSKTSCHRKMVNVGGRHTTFRQYSEPHGYWIQAEDVRDIGTEITFFARDEYSTWRKETLALLNPPEYAQSQGMQYKAFGNVIKPVTNGRIRVYAYDPNTNERLLIAVYQPYDINPNFLRFSLPGCGDCLTVYAKRKYYALQDANELVEFPVQAMIHALLANNYLENRNSQGFGTELGIAVAEINREIADEEEDVGSPLRMFATNHPENLTPFCGNYYGAYDW